MVDTTKKMEKLAERLCEKIFEEPNEDYMKDKCYSFFSAFMSFMIVLAISLTVVEKILNIYGFFFR